MSNERNDLAVKFITNRESAAADEKAMTERFTAGLREELKCERNRLESLRDKLEYAERSVKRLKAEIRSTEARLQHLEAEIETSVMFERDVAENELANYVDILREQLEEARRRAAELRQEISDGEDALRRIKERIKYGLPKPITV